MDSSLLYEAIENEDYKSIKMEIDNGAIIDNKVLEDVIRIFADIDILRLLVKFTNIHEISLTLLMCVNRHRYEDFIIVLVEAGGNIERVLDDKLDRQKVIDTLLKNAIDYALPLIVIQQLIKLGAVINQHSDRKSVV